MNFDTEGEVVATGDLFKQATGGAKAWALRHFVLVGPYFVYYTHDGSKKKGQLDISDCTVRICEPDECGSKNAKYAFIVEGPNKSLLVCASNERNRVAWMILLCQQTEEFSNVIRRYLKSGEDVHANTVIKKRSNFGMSSKIRIVVTNFPRIIIIDPISCKLLEQIIWNRKSPPTLTIENAVRFKITHGRKILNLEDNEGGSEFWREIFSRFPDMKYYVPRKRPMSMQVDFTETGHEDFYTRRDRLQRAALNTIAEGEEEEKTDTQFSVHTNNSSTTFLRSSLYSNDSSDHSNPILPPITTGDIPEKSRILYSDQSREDAPQFLRVSLYEPPDLSEFDESTIPIDESNSTNFVQKSSAENQTDENFGNVNAVPPKVNMCDAWIQTDPIDDTDKTPVFSTKTHSEIGTTTDLQVSLSINFDNEVGTSTDFRHGTSYDMGTSIDVDLETFTDVESFSVSPREADDNEVTSSRSLPSEFEDDDDLVEGIDINYMNPRMSMMLCNLNDLDLSSLLEVVEPLDTLGPKDEIDDPLDEIEQVNRQSILDTNSNLKSVERPKSICIEVETPANENDDKKVREFSYLELMRRLEAKSTNKKPPTMIMPSSDPKLKTQYFGTQRVVYKPHSSSSLN